MAKLHVRLDKSDNERLHYPAYGVLELFEIGTNHRIITGVFTLDGYGGPVVVKNPIFTYPAQESAA